MYTFYVPNNNHWLRVAMVDSQGVAYAIAKTLKEIYPDGVYFIRKAGKAIITNNNLLVFEKVA